MLWSRNVTTSSKCSHICLLSNDNDLYFAFDKKKYCYLWNMVRLFTLWAVHIISKVDLCYLFEHSRFIKSFVTCVNNILWSQLVDNRGRLLKNAMIALNDSWISTYSYTISGSNNIRPFYKYDCIISDTRWSVLKLEDRVLNIRLFITKSLFNSVGSCKQFQGQFTLSINKQRLQYFGG